MLEDIGYDEILQRELLEILSKLDKKLIFQHSTTRIILLESFNNFQKCSCSFDLPLVCRRAFLFIQSRSIYINRIYRKTSRFSSDILRISTDSLSIISLCQGFHAYIRIFRTRIAILVVFFFTIVHERFHLTTLVWYSSCLCHAIYCDNLA